VDRRVAVVLTAEPEMLVFADVLHTSYATVRNDVIQLSMAPHIGYRSASSRRMAMDMNQQSFVAAQAPGEGCRGSN
jgi:hypothetical protein